MFRALAKFASAFTIFFFFKRRFTLLEPPLPTLDGLRVVVLPRPISTELSLPLVRLILLPRVFCPFSMASSSARSSSNSSFVAFLSRPLLPSCCVVRARLCVWLTSSLLLLAYIVVPSGALKRPCRNFSFSLRKRLISPRKSIINFFCGSKKRTGLFLIRAHDILNLSVRNVSA